MAAGSLIGGVMGGALAGRIDPNQLRWVVVGVGTVVGIVLLLRL